MCSLKYMYVKKKKIHNKVYNIRSNKELLYYYYNLDSR